MTKQKKTIYAALSFLMLALFGLSPTAGGIDDHDDHFRGERQMSFTDGEASSFPAHGPDSRYAKEKRANQSEALASKERDLPRSSWFDRSELRTDRQAAGRAGVWTELGESPYDRSFGNGEMEFRNGRAAGQMSNVPGSTSTSPNGTSNFFGTGGIPIFTEDLQGNGKLGNPDSAR